MDSRTQLAKSLQASYKAIAEDVGGGETVSHVKSALIERFVWLEAILRDIEQDLAKGEADKLGRWVQAVNSLSGLAKTLGVERKAPPNPWEFETSSQPASEQAEVSQ